MPGETLIVTPRSFVARRTSLQTSGFPDAAERQAKLRLAYALNQVLEHRKLSQAEAAVR